MKKVEGLIVAPFTPFGVDNEVNFEPIAAYAEMLSANKLKGVFINGSSGEGYMLTTEERILLTNKWISVVPNDFKVIVHVGSCCVKDSVAMAKHAEIAGAWGIGAMAPPFPKIVRIEELVDYCEVIAAAAPSLPFYYYHIPFFNGVNLSMVDLLKAVDGRIPNFAGIKFTFEAMYDYHQCCLYKDGKYDMLHGQDETILNSLIQGHTKGGICGTANYNGKALVEIVDAYNSGNIELAREKQDFAQAVINVIARYRGNIVAGKRIMKLIGLDLGRNRVPFRNITDQEEIAIKEELDSIGFFEHCNKF